MKNSELSQLARDFFDYKDGKLFWNQNRRPRIKKGDRAGTIDQYGYRKIGINGKYYLEHRLIYAYHNPHWDGVDEIDHINGVRDDNQIENLRVVTSQENNFNNTKARGYYWNKRDKKWTAQIAVNRKKKFLGYFDKEEEAHQAYLKAKEKLHIIEDRK